MCRGTNTRHITYTSPLSYLIGLLVRLPHHFGQASIEQGRNRYRQVRLADANLTIERDDSNCCRPLLAG